MNFDRVTLYAVQRERYLLAVAAIFLLLTTATLAVSMRAFWPPVLLLAIWASGAVLAHRGLNRLLPRRDPFIFPITMLLTGWGLLLILRLAPNFAWRQALWLLISLAAMLAITRLPQNLRWLRRFRYTWLGGGLLLLLLTILFGVNPSGAGPRLWLGLGVLYFQPSELLKLVLVFFLASYLTDYHVDLYRGQPFRRWLSALRALGPLLLMWGICMVMTIWQRDLGTATLFFIVFLAMLYIASGRVSYVIMGTALLFLAAIVAYRLFDVVQLRIEIWLNPWLEADSRGFQIVQSLMAFASGGIFGTGINLGAPGYIPVVHSDFIFAAIGEEWGLLGTASTLVCLSILIMRGLQLASLWAESYFRMLLAAGLSILLATQSILIIGGVLRVVPLTGVTLPFVSYGGSSLLINYILIGLLLLLSAPPATESATP